MEIDSKRWRQTVIEGARALGLSLSIAQAQAMGRHARELLHWNRTTNLTAITDPVEVAIKHYVDALAAVPWIGEGVRVLDAGSGGGFPGIPIRIARPDLSVTLVDSVRKKVSFLKHAIRTLGLDRIDAVHGRLEVLGGRAAYQRQFDVVVCRALSSLDSFVRLAQPFLSPGGMLLAMKGPGWNTKKTFRIGSQSFWIESHRYRLPGRHATRCLVRLGPGPVARRPKDRTDAAVSV